MATTGVPIPAVGALPPIIYSVGTPVATTQYGVLSNSVANLYWPGGTAASATPVRRSRWTPGQRQPRIGAAAAGSHYLGSAATGATTDARQHPYWRTEHLQRIMNQTTVRTHQYAVWITVGFFEVTKQGDLAMLSSPNPQLAFDTLGAEVGAVTGNITRYRGFFLIDRTKLTGFTPSNTGSFRAAVTYRKIIQ